MVLDVRIAVDEAPPTFFAVPGELATIVYLGDTVVAPDEVAAAASKNLSILHAWDVVTIDDSDTEPPDFTVPDDDLGF